ncbi:MAG: phage tail protein [Planctomycetes bacterium]|nr:phage tail protein [Planctomycetota bacterium]
MSERRDPYRSFRFVVEIGSAPAGGFSSVGGLERATTVDEYREGGVNDFVHKLAGVTKHPALVLKRGIADRVDLWDWHQEVIAGRIQRRGVAIVLRDESGRDVCRWVFDAAFPAKWNGSDLDAQANTVAVESIELVHHGMRRG